VGFLRNVDENLEDGKTILEDSVSEYSMPTLQEMDSEADTLAVMTNDINTVPPRISPPSPPNKNHRRGIGYENDITRLYTPPAGMDLASSRRAPSVIDDQVDSSSTLRGSQAATLTTSSSGTELVKRPLSFSKMPSFIPAIVHTTPPVPASFPQSVSAVSLASSSSSPSVISMSLSGSSLASTPRRGRAVISALRGLLEDGDEDEMDNARRLFDRESKWSMKSKVSIRSRKRRSSDVVLPSLPSLPIVSSVEGTDLEVGYVTPVRKRPMPLGRMPKDVTPFARSSTVTSLVRNGTITRNGSITGAPASLHSRSSRKSVVRLTMSASQGRFSWQALPSSSSVASAVSDMKGGEVSVEGLSRMTLNISPEEWDELEELIGQLKVEFPELMKMRMSMKAAKRTSKESQYEFQVGVA